MTKKYIFTVNNILNNKIIFKSRWGESLILYIKLNLVSYKKFL